jgi:hypothetical protein
MRVVSEEIQNVLDSRGYSSYWLFDLRLPESDAQAVCDIYASDGAVAANGHFYKPLIRGAKPRLTQSLGKAPDGGSVTLDNTSGELSRQLLARGRDIQGARFTLWKAFVIGANTDGTPQLGVDKWMSGEARAANVSENDQSVTLQLNSDLLPRRAVVGAHMLTQRCITAFNKGGILSPDNSVCGWQTIQGGNPDFCDKTEEGEAGCKAHGNLHRMIAVPAIATAPVSTILGGDGTGLGGGGHNCFLAGTPILLHDGTCKPIEKIEIGDRILSPVYRHGADATEDCEVENVIVSRAAEWLTLRFPHAIIKCTPAHRLYTGYGSFYAVRDIAIGEAARVFSAGQFISLPLLDKTKHMGDVEVFNLTVAESQTYFAGGVAAHNVKSEFPILI